MRCLDARESQAGGGGFTDLGCSVAIVDANDLGVNILAQARPEYSNGLLARLLKDNPLGQGAEQTPIGIIRRMPGAAVQEDVLEELRT